MSVERLSAQDLLMLWPDDFGWSGDIGALAVLEAPAAGPRRSRPDRSGPSTAGSETAACPRFRQLLYRPRLELGCPLWVDAPTFELADHVRVLPLAAVEELVLRTMVPISLHGQQPGRAQGNRDAMMIVPRRDCWKCSRYC